MTRTATKPVIFALAVVALATVAPAPVAAQTEYAGLPPSLLSNSPYVGLVEGNVPATDPYVGAVGAVGSSSPTGATAVSASLGPGSVGSPAPADDAADDGLAAPAPSEPVSPIVTTRDLLSLGVMAAVALAGFGVLMARRRIP